MTTITNPAKGIIEKKIEELKKTYKEHRTIMPFDFTDFDTELKAQIEVLQSLLPLIPDIELPGDEEIENEIKNRFQSSTRNVQRIVGAKWLRDKIQKQLKNK